MTRADKQHYWQKHITAWQSSGLSQQTYCQQHQLKLATFGYWRGRLREVSETTSEPERSFIPLGPLLTGPAEPSVSVTLTDGLQVQIPASIIEQALPLVLQLSKAKC